MSSRDGADTKDVGMSAPSLEFHAHETLNQAKAVQVTFSRVFLLIIVR